MGWSRKVRLSVALGPRQGQPGSLELSGNALPTPSRAVPSPSALLFQRWAGCGKQEDLPVDKDFPFPLFGIGQRPLCSGQGHPQQSPRRACPLPSAVPGTTEPGLQVTHPRWLAWIQPALAAREPAELVLGLLGSLQVSQPSQGPLRELGRTRRAPSLKEEETEACSRRGLGQITLNLGQS